MSDVQETDLPGIGVRYDFRTRYGDSLGLLVHRTGRRELLVYTGDDPDCCVVTVRLDPEDAATLSEVLGAGRITERLTGLHQDVAGLAIDWILVAPDGPWAGLTLGEAAVHTTTGVSIVAVVRDDETISAPGASTVLRPGDTVVAVGTVAGLSAAAARLQGS